MVEKVRIYMEQQGMIPENGNVVAGVSGGADSVCLLLVLTKLRKKLGLTLSVVHVDHGLRKEAGEDAAFVQELCARLEVPFVLRRADVAQIACREGISGEEAGRNVRYEAFEEQLLKMDAVTGGHGCIAVAHNRDDRAETFLFHLFRGTGLDGMAGIRPVRPAGTYGRIIRPLLDVSREEIEKFLRAEGMEWRTDATNAGELYTRNRIRNRILPYAEEAVCAGAKEHLAREAALLQETSEYVHGQMLEALGRCMQETEEGTEQETEQRQPGQQADSGSPVICLSVPKLQGESPFLRKLCIRECMQRAGRIRDLSSAHVEAAAALASERCQSGKYLSLPVCRIKVVREFDRLAFYSLAQQEKSEEAFRIPQQGSVAETVCGMNGNETSQSGNAVREIPVACGLFFVPGLGEVRARILPGARTEQGSGAGDENGNELSRFLQNIPQKKYTKWFDYDKIIESATFRTRRKGDYLTINEAMDTKSLKRYMIEEKIPASERDRMWVLADGAHIIWLPGYRISAGYKVTAGTENILEICCSREREPDDGTDCIRGGKRNG